MKALWSPSESKPNTLYSVGLDSQIFGFDIEKQKATFEISLKRDNKPPPSIYSITGENTGRFIVTGNPPLTPSHPTLQDHLTVSLVHSIPESEFPQFSN